MSSSSVLGSGLSFVYIVHSLLISCYFSMNHLTFVSAKGATLTLSSVDETLLYTDNEFDQLMNLQGTIYFELHDI